MSQKKSSLSSAAARSGPETHGLARVLSKLGVCSRRQAEIWIREGRVSVKGRNVRDPWQPTPMTHDGLAIDGRPVAVPKRVHIMFNKPRGLVVSAADERGRDTVYKALSDADLPWLGPVGRLDKASEGLLLLGNDTQWAAGITDPVGHVAKTYHVQVKGQPDAAVLDAMRAGVVDDGDVLKVVEISLLRAGEKNAWFEVVLDEGRNRHIRRLLSSQGFEVLRLLRVAIGSLELGDLPKGRWRHLTSDEVKSLAPER